MKLISLSLMVIFIDHKTQLSFNRQQLTMTALSPRIRAEQLDRWRFIHNGNFHDPEKHLSDTLYAMPSKFLRGPREIIKTYSRLLTHAYPKLPFDDYKLTITCFTIELTLARNAPNAVYDITDLSQYDVAAMAKLEAVPLCNDTTFFLHAVHLSLMKFICGEYGPTEGMYERLLD